MVSIRLPEEIEHRLNQLAEVTQRSKSFYIKEALEQYLEEIEDYYLALERTRKPKRKYLTGKELLQKLTSNKK